MRELNRIYRTYGTIGMNATVENPLLFYNPVHPVKPLYFHFNIVCPQISQWLKKRDFDRTYGRIREYIRFKKRRAGLFSLL